MVKYFFIKNAKYIDGYKIAFRFNDNKESIVDFKNFIIQSKHPDIKKYKDKNIFKSFNLQYNEIEWNDYDLTFPIYDLYKNKI